MEVGEKRKCLRDGKCTQRCYWPGQKQLQSLINNIGDLIQACMRERAGMGFFLLSRRLRCYNNMSLIYTVIAREEVMLAEFTPFSGNFVLTAQQILKRCTPNRKYAKFSASNYIFYVLYEDLIYLVMADLKYSERIAFSYLDNIRKLFLSNYSLEKALKLQMYGAMDFAVRLRGNMELYNSPEEVDNVAKLWKQTEEVNQILNEDLQKLLNREQKIDILVKKTQTMGSLSLDMNSSTKTIKRAMIWQNWKMRILIFFVVLLVIYFIMVLICGGITLSGCF